MAVRAHAKLKKSKLNFQVGTKYLTSAQSNDFNKVLFHHSRISDCFSSYSDLSFECSKERCARAVLSVNLDIWTNLETAGCYLHFPQSNSAPNKNYCELGKISRKETPMIRGCS